MYQVRITQYAGGEVAVATSFLALREEKNVEEAIELPEVDAPPPLILDYSAELETASRARRSGYGDEPLRKTKFTREASKTIQRCARALDEFSDLPEHIIFMTGTLPGTGKRQYEAIAAYSSYIIHRLKAWVAKRVPGKYDFYCWELQKRGALHIHYAVHCPDPVLADELLSGFKDEWVRLLREVGERTNVNLFLNEEKGIDWSKMAESVQAKAEKVTKSVGAYLGKYLSKSSRGTNKHGRFAPCRWWGVSRPLRALEESLRQEHTEFFWKPGKAISFADDVLTFAGNMADSCFTWVNKVGHGVGGVIFGALPNTLQKVITLLKTGQTDMADKSVRLFGAYCELMQVVELAQVNNDRWFQGLSRYMGGENYLEEAKKITLKDLRQSWGICALQALIWKMEDVMARSLLFGGRTLDYRWRQHILHCIDVIQGVLREIYAEEYEADKSEGFYTIIEREYFDNVKHSKISNANSNV